MLSRRILILGNSGSGKTTMARALQRAYGLVHLDLDLVAWGEDGKRLPLEESVAALRAFQEAHATWVIEGSYGRLVEAALPACAELRFLNPGVAACVANCRRRPWEPEKYATPEAQDAGLAFLLEWVRQYPARADEYGLNFHRAVFEAFDGPKREYTDLTEITSPP